MQVLILKVKEVVKRLTTLQSLGAIPGFFIFILLFLVPQSYPAIHQ